MANVKVLPALTATGSDQTVSVPRGSSLCILGDNDVTIRHASGGDGFTIAADTPFWLGPFSEQTLYVSATEGATIQLMLG